MQRATTDGRNAEVFEVVTSLLNYLHNRKQRVVVNHAYSEYSLIESAVPQGLVLAPLSFLIYINEKNENSNILADDIMLYRMVQVIYDV